MAHVGATTFDGRVQLARYHGLIGPTFGRRRLVGRIRAGRRARAMPIGQR